MSDDLVSLRLLLVTAEQAQQELWRQGAALASVPLELEAASAAGAKAALGRGAVDFCVIDAGLTEADSAAVIRAARAKQPAPLIFMSAPAGSTPAGTVDGTLARPQSADDARTQVETCIRAKLPTTVLIVDASEATRGIVRKILAASRFALDVHESADGSGALAQMRNGKFGMVLLDHGLPDIAGAEIVAAIRRADPEVAIVTMATAADGNPQLPGTRGFLRKPFYPADVDAVLERFFGLKPDAPGA